MKNAFRPLGQEIEPSFDKSLKQRLINEMLSEIKNLTTPLDDELNALKMRIDEIREQELPLFISKEYDKRVKVISKSKDKIISFSVFRFLQKIQFYAKIQLDRETLINELKKSQNLEIKEPKILRRGLPQHSVKAVQKR